MDVYISTLNSIGDAVIEWTDPENQFRGHTEVRKHGNTFKKCMGRFIITVQLAGSYNVSLLLSFERDGR
jgi:hypothetical protein